MPKFAGKCAYTQIPAYEHLISKVCKIKIYPEGMQKFNFDAKLVIGTLNYQASIEIGAKTRLEVHTGLKVQDLALVMSYTCKLINATVLWNSVRTPKF